MRFDDNEIERILRVVNYMDHPHNNNYLVFLHKTKERADFFETLLTTNSIPFESDTDVSKDGKVFLFGISKIYQKEAHNFNYETIGKYRDPIFAKSKSARIAIILFGLAVVITAIIGAIIGND